MEGLKQCCFGVSCNLVGNGSWIELVTKLYQAYTF